MDPTIMSAATVLAYAAQPVSGALPPYEQANYVTTVQSIRIATPTINLSPIAVEIEAELENVIYASMERDFERRYAL